MTYVDHAPSRQITGVVAVVAIHAALVIALMNGLVARIEPVLKPVTKVFFVPTSQPKPDPVVKPDKVVADMPRVDPVPVPPVVIEPQEEVIEVPLVDLPPQAPSTGEAISEPSPLQVDPNKALTRPEYPATSIRLNEEGKVKLLVYVLPDGRVGDVKVSRSSGYARLDASAMREARKSWRFLPAKNNSGQAVAAWGTFEVAFQLQN